MTITCPCTHLIPTQPPEQAPYPLSFQLFKKPCGSVSSCLKDFKASKSDFVTVTPSQYPDETT
ncbi:hypothetical protein HanIR_Chr05g0227901 [Helianthus annuus]|nr:hypothetical protein HanIR_Chr05g0227901 [Helianthus annuus]